MEGSSNKDEEPERKLKRPKMREDGRTRKLRKLELREQRTKDDVERTRAQEIIKAQVKELQEKNETIQEKNETIQEKDKTIKEMKDEIGALRKVLGKEVRGRVRCR